MAGQMAWLSAIQDTEKLLYLRIESHHHWRPYTAFPQFSVPDYRIPKGSKGWATYQKLRECGWELVSSEAAEQGIKELMEAGR